MTPFNTQGPNRVDPKQVNKPTPPPPTTDDFMGVLNIMHQRANQKAEEGADLSKLSRAQLVKGVRAYHKAQNKGVRIPRGATTEDIIKSIEKWKIPRKWFQTTAKKESKSLYVIEGWNLFGDGDDPIDHGKFELTNIYPSGLHKGEAMLTHSEAMEQAKFFPDPGMDEHMKMYKPTKKTQQHMW